MMQKLSDSTVRQISSGQVISDIPCVVKELVENAFDSGASRIDITLQNFGLDKIEVTDDGCGISSEDAPNLALRHFTSKLADFDGLQSVLTYGFRGEGLASICAVADLAVVTRQAGDNVARAYLFNTAGKIITTSFVAAKPGTSVQVTRLFSNFPVRRNQFRGLRRLQDTLVAIEKLALGFALAHPSVQVGLTHGMERVFAKPCCEDRPEAVRLVLGRQRAAALVRLHLTKQEAQVELFLPRPAAADDKRLFAAAPRLAFVFVNSRPVEMAEFHKLLRNLSRDVYNQPNRYPTSVLYVTLPTHRTDVNLEPNKTRVVFEEMADLLEWLPQEIMLQLASTKNDGDDSSSVAAPIEPDPLAWSMGRCLPKQPTEPTKATENPHGKNHKEPIESLLIPPEQNLSKFDQSFEKEVEKNLNFLDALAGKDQTESCKSSNVPTGENPAEPYKSSEVSTGENPAESYKSSEVPIGENPAESYESSEVSTGENLVESCKSSDAPTGQNLEEHSAPPTINRDLLAAEASKDLAASFKAPSLISTPTNLKFPDAELDEMFQAESRQPTNQNSRTSKESTPSRSERKRKVSSSPADRKEKRTRTNDPFQHRETEDATFSLEGLRQRLVGANEQSLEKRIVVGVLPQLDACVIREDSEILLGNTRRILEMHEEQRLRKHCQLPSVRLPNPLDVREISCLSPEDLAKLEDLPTQEVSDQRGTACLVLCPPELLRNGFRLQRAEDSFQVTRVPAPFEHDFGPVLGELLAHLRSPSASCTANFRPTSVTRHFLNEARRSARCQATDRLSARDLELRFLGPLLSNGAMRASRAICGHNKPAFGPLWHLPDAPQL